LKTEFQKTNFNASCCIWSWIRAQKNWKTDILSFTNSILQLHQFNDNCTYCTLQKALQWRNGIFFRRLQAITITYHSQFLYGKSV